MCLLLSRYIWQRSFVVLALFLTAEVVGQQFTDEQGGAIPNTSQVLDPNTGMPEYVWLAYEGYRPRYGIKSDSPTVIGKRAKFMQEFGVILEVQPDNTEKKSQGQLFLGKVDSQGNVLEKFGWVDAAYVVRRNEPIIDKRTSLFKKLRVVNTAQSIATAQKEGKSNLAAVNVIHRPELPGENETPAHSFRLSNLFFVYAEAPDFLLIGSAPYFKTDSPTDVVKGWIPSNRASLWNTRMALEWHWESTSSRLPATQRRTEPGRILAKLAQVDGQLQLDHQATEDFAQEFWTSLNSSSYSVDADQLKAATSFPEVFEDNGESSPLDHKTPRFPILEATPIASAVPQGNILYNVGWFNRKVSGIDLTDFEARLFAVSESAKKLDMVIVIDHTGSMEKYFPIVSQALGMLFLDLQKQTVERDVRVCVSYYGDERHSTTPYVINRLASLTISDARRANKVSNYIAEYLAFQKTQKSQQSNFFERNPPNFDIKGTVVEVMKEVHNHRRQGGGDNRENVFKGIQKAIEGAGFRPQAQKQVIVLGDMGDISQEGAVGKTTQWAQRNRIISQLFPIEQPIGLCVIHTAQGTRADEKLFQIQLSSITKKANERLASDNLARQKYFGLKQSLPAERLYDFIPATKLDLVQSLLVRQYQDLQARIDQMSKEIAAVSAGEWNKTVGPATLRLLDAEGVDLQKLRSAEGAQVYQEGYVWKYSAKKYDGQYIPQVRPRVMLNHEEIGELIDALSAIVGPRAGLSTTRQMTIAELVEEEIAVASGEDNANRSMKDKWRVLSRFPVRNQIMRLPPAQLRNYLRDSKNVRDLQMKLARLQDVENNLWHDWKFKQSTSSSGRSTYTLTHTQEKIVDRSFKIQGDLSDRKYYWLIMETELP